MAPSNIKQETIRFNLDIPAQANAYQIYSEMLAFSPDCKSLGALLPKVLTVLAEVAKDHPALCDRTALLVAKHQDKVLALLAMLEAGENVDHLLTAGGPPAPPQVQAVQALPRRAAPKAPTATPIVSDGDIEIDFAKL